MVVTMVIQLLAFALLIGVIVGIAKLFGKLPSFMKGGKIGYWVFRGYVILLLIGSLFYIGIAQVEPPYEVVTNEEVMEAKRVEEKILNEIYAGKEPSFSSPYVERKVEEYSIDSSQVQLKVYQPDYVPWVFIQRKATDDETIEVVQYKTSMIQNRVNFSSEVPFYKISFKEDNLTILNVGDTHFETSYVEGDFTVSQFMEGGSMRNAYENRAHLKRIVIIKIPPSLDFDGDYEMLLP
ncbi:hypothetical protein Q73_15725 [Bacillus coahuilensis m2-6]|uniref:Uncharacterized protein n=1 Tax=Bacillus coahuilensis p1.1.43 TaxID=1150625 RepID=A0A147K572_9BACI|nr:hypothetical protein [Bacillus coahuilensis]KUP04328.1 hypothetical protein Q73_15725 [Bacillus coahuilensis m2-6]KUP04729.1 hypothetical protein Q75_14890 [Bacillus coahuilensis p1.1.43]